MSAIAPSIAAFLPPRYWRTSDTFSSTSPIYWSPRHGKSSNHSIRRKPVNVVVLDPSAEDIECQRSRRTAEALPVAPPHCVCHAPRPAFRLSPSSDALGSRTLSPHFDDAPERFRERVEQVQGNSLTHRVIEELNGSLRMLPRTALRHDREPVSTATPLHERARLGDGRDRHRQRVSETWIGTLGSPKRLLIAAKVLRRFRLSAGPSYSVLDVSIKLG